LLFFLLIIPGAPHSGPGDSADVMCWLTWLLMILIFFFSLACWMAGAVAVLSEFMKKDMTRIRNKSAFVNGIIDRVHKELAHEKVCVIVLSASRDSC
jgi:hypothetical protein